MVNRFDVFLINLDLETSDDPKNSRPAVVISPDEINHNIDHVIIAPLSSTNSLYPTRVAVTFLNSKRFIILDQLRTIETNRLVKKIGLIESSDQAGLLERLQELFA